mmetsp:Transcript_3995/g.12760  ORF Transcript_3995/g.12760 Transcript_3995/m.12760 type:complete len:221 (+) Transcript_3995:1160-1822(+)
MGLGPSCTSSPQPIAVGILRATDSGRVRGTPDARCAFGAVRQRTSAGRSVPTGGQRADFFGRAPLLAAVGARAARRVSAGASGRRGAHSCAAAGAPLVQAPSARSVVCVAGAGDDANWHRSEGGRACGSGCCAWSHVLHSRCWHGNRACNPGRGERRRSARCDGAAAHCDCGGCRRGGRGELGRGGRPGGGKPSCASPWSQGRARLAHGTASRAVDRDWR